jgi:hypothetical protein
MTVINDHMYYTNIYCRIPISEPNFGFLNPEKGKRAAGGPFRPKMEV